MPLLSLLRRPSLLASVVLHGVLGGLAFGVWREPAHVARPAELVGLWSSDVTGAADAPEVAPPPDVVPRPEEIPVAAPMEVLPPPPEEALELPDADEAAVPPPTPGPGLPPVGVRRAPLARPTAVAEAPPTPALPAPSLPAPAAPPIVEPPSAASRAGSRVNRDARDLPTNAPPAYPADALRNGWEGTVLVEVRTDAMGAVERAAVARSSGYPSLDGSAVAAVRGWSFAPRLVDGVPAPDWFYKPVVFTLRTARR